MSENTLEEILREHFPDGLPMSPSVEERLPIAEALENELQIDPPQIE